MQRKNKTNLVALFALLLCFYYLNNLKSPSALFQAKDSSLNTLRDWGHILRYALGEKDERVLAASVTGLDSLNLRKETFFLRESSARYVEKEIVPAINTFMSSLSQQGVTTLLLPVPMKTSLYRDRLPKHLPPPDSFHTYDQDGDTKETDRIYHSFKSIDPAHVVDLFEVYTKETKNLGKPDLYLPFDYHWSSYGISVAATAILNQLHQLSYPIKKTESVFTNRFLAPQYKYYLLNTYQLPEWFLKRQPVLDWRQPLYRVSSSGNTAPFKRLILFGSSMCNYLEDAHQDLGTILGESLHLTPIKICRDGAGIEGAIKAALKDGFKLQSGDVVVWEFFVGDLPHQGRVDLPHLEVLSNPNRSLSGVPQTN